MKDAEISVATFRSIIQHESEQAHRRLSSLGAFQGFLFASLGFSWGKNSSLTLIICLLGVAVAGIIAGILAIRRTCLLWHQHKPPDYHGPDIFGYFPEQASFMILLGSEVLLPIAFAIAWSAVIAIR
jgi:hypothetical protein